MNTMNVWFNAGVKVNGTAQIVTGHNQELIIKSQTTAGKGWDSIATKSTCYTETKIMTPSRVSTSDVACEYN